MKAIAMNDENWGNAAIDSAKELERRFPVIMRQTRDSIYATIFRIVRDEQDAEDLLQDTYLRAITRLSSYRGDGVPEAWLRRIAVRLSLNFLRARKLRRMLPWPLPRGEDGSLVETIEGSDRRSGPDEKAETVERRLRLETLLEGHPAKARAAFALRHFEDRPYTEIAELIGCSDATARSLVSRAVSRLEREIRERGWNDE